jgi:hypothetical protein
VRTVTVTETFPGSVSEAERCWYDTPGWAIWVDGLDRVIEVSRDWPRSGAAVRWQSGPAGRGHVLERVITQEPLGGQELAVEDDSIRGRQRVDFVPAEGGVEVSLRLSYELKRRSPMTPVVDLLFIRRAMASSLQRTLASFGLRLAELAPGSVRH